ncbi:type II toxin-antitoxin system PemK/MazF family toxin [Streptomyces smyrnaeus]|uniref:Type II toxin-antitoxin system PemK/MazF family toxin n=1 Tax=Streptomyces smyrnaeus TaxID=1387713 RepID=A0ABS3Y015_9ACTN|nr:type II toxin-antitoxin system PemK/MazF family toxin [Streptomyces smyrnaeus]MBO8200996.1 type II toxin-antitoxin system PemK/MazF family toxin [Streptomyces smyrnaeus]
MDTSWWLALGGVVLLAFVAALVDGRGRLGPPRRALRAASAADEGTPPPRPGEIWRATLPDGGEALFLVLAVWTDGARLARLTREPSALPVLAADAPAGPAYLEPDSLAEAGLARLRARCGEVDPATWEGVCRTLGLR